MSYARIHVILSAVIFGLAVTTAPASNTLLSSQHCERASVYQSAPIEFDLNHAAEVTDQRTGLIWQRCAWGQTWQTGTCQGTAAALTFAAATQLEAKQRQLTGLDWRLPSLPELSGLADLHCHDPAINLIAFPNTAARTFWSNTAFANKPQHYWLVHFIDGGNLIESGDQTALVRLVRRP